MAIFEGFVFFVVRISAFVSTLGKRIDRKALTPAEGMINEVRQKTGQTINPFLWQSEPVVGDSDCPFDPPFCERFASHQILAVGKNSSQH